MSVTVRIPTPLRSATAGNSQVDLEAASVHEMIDALEREFPGIRDRLCDEAGQIRRFVNIFVGDEDIRFLAGMDTRLSDGTQVSIIPAVAGG